MSKIACLPVGLFLLLLSLGLFSFLPDAAAGDDDGCLQPSIQWTPRSMATLSSASTRKVCAPGCTRKGWRPETRTPSGCLLGRPFPMCHSRPMCSASRPVSGSAGPERFQSIGCPGAPGLGCRTTQRQGNFAGRVRGLRLSSGSQVWLFIGAHGQAHASDNRARARQLLTPEIPPSARPCSATAWTGRR